MPVQKTLRQDLMNIATLLRDRLLPHEREDESMLYLQLEKALRGVDPLGAMSRAHREIFHKAAQRYDIKPKKQALL